MGSTLNFRVFSYPKAEVEKDLNSHSILERFSTDISTQIKGPVSLKKQTALRLGDAPKHLKTISDPNMPANTALTVPFNLQRLRRFPTPLNAALGRCFHFCVFFFNEIWTGLERTIGSTNDSDLLSGAAGTAVQHAKRNN
jgi:hypothetical protein